MIRHSSIELSRRSLMTRAAAAGATLILPQRLLAAELVITPGQTEGPFYPVEFPPDIDSDLVQVRGQAAQALGTVTHLSGRVMDSRGLPKPGSVVEIWQCDSNGVYRHPRAAGQ